MLIVCSQMLVILIIHIDHDMLVIIPHLNFTCSGRLTSISAMVQLRCYLTLGGGLNLP